MYCNSRDLHSFPTRRSSDLDVQDYPPDQQIIRSLDQPIKKDSHLVILGGNLAPDGAVAKISGKEGESFTGKARVFDREEDALDRKSTRLNSSHSQISYAVL